MTLRAATLKSWSDEVALAPKDHHARLDAALARQPAVRRWVERHVRGLRMSAQGVALYYTAILLSAWDPRGSAAPLSANRLGAALEALTGRVEGVDWDGLRPALTADLPDDAPRRVVLHAVLDPTPPAGALPLRDAEPAALALLLSALADVLGGTPCR